MCLALNLVLVGACTSLRPVRFEENPEKLLMLQAGERVRVVTKDGGEREFEITAITPDVLSARDFQVRRDQIVTLEVRRVDKVKVALIVAGAVAALATITLYALAAGNSKIVNSSTP